MRTPIFMSLMLLMQLSAELSLMQRTGDITITYSFHFMLGIETMAIGMDTVDSEKAPSCPLSSPALLSHESKESYFMWICLLSFRCSFLLFCFLALFPLRFSCPLFFLSVFLYYVYSLALTYFLLFLSFLIFSIPSSASSSLLLFLSLFLLWESLGVKRIRWERRRIGYNSCSKVVKNFKECSDFVDKWTKEKSSGKSSSKRYMKPFWESRPCGTISGSWHYFGTSICIYKYIYLLITILIYCLFMFIYSFEKAMEQDNY